MTDVSPAATFASMQELEADLQSMQNEWAAAEDTLVRTGAQVERLKAPRRLTLKKDPPEGVTKPTREDLDALVLEWLWTEHEPLMVENLNAEALCAAYGVKYKCADKALSSKQTRLNVETKLAFGNDPTHRRQQWQS